MSAVPSIPTLEEAKAERARVAKLLDPPSITDRDMANAQRRAGQSGDAGSPHNALTLRSAIECAATLPKGDWLLRPYLERNATAICYGDFGTYKSFIALDWALRVAIGIPAIGSGYFREPAPVVFISAEGRGLAKRLRAWCLHTYPDRDWQDVLRDVPLRIVEHAVNLSDAANAHQLVAAAEGAGITPALVVIDTLSRNSNGDVESSTGDASAYLANLDQHLRAKFRCAILLVHHVGHVEKGRIRGPIVLAANTDTLIRVERVSPGEAAVNVSVERLKDADLPPPASLRAIVVNLGEIDEDGQPITSLALEDNGVAVPAKHEPSGKNQAALLAGVREWARNHDGSTHITSLDLQAVAAAQGLKDRRRRGEAVEGLTKAGFLVAAVGGFRIEP